MCAVSSRDGLGAGFQLPFQIRTDGLQPLGRGGFETEDQRGLRVGGANESPAVIETNPDAVDRDDFTDRGTRMMVVVHMRLPCRLDQPVSYCLDHLELLVIRTLQANLRVTCEAGRSASKAEKGASAFDRISINRHEA